MKMDRRVQEALKATAEIYGRQMSDMAAAMFVADLSRYTADQVLEALARCRRDLRTFPTIADIVARVNDGRPGAEEAWAMIPKDEGASVVWTEEMQSAYGTCRELLADDPIAARMAFRETYQRLVTEARAENRPAKWTPSLGHDKTQRESVIMDAAIRGYLSPGQANALLPESLPVQANRALLEAPSGSDEVNEDNLKRIRELIANVSGLKSIPAGKKSGLSLSEMRELSNEELERVKRGLREQARMIESDPQFNASPVMEWEDA